MRAPAFSCRELVLAAVVVGLGVALRLVAFSHSAVEHFDEGVYASNLYFGPPDYAYPQQRFFAPPLLPALIEAGMIVGLPPNIAALLPSFLAGCGTIAAVWWLGRLWFGPEVGLSAAALVALSDYLVAFSATALTDVLLGLWLVLALGSIARSLLLNDVRWAVAAGLFTGLAWWTKYNGWLPLVIGGAALPLHWLALRPPPKQLLDWFFCLVVTAVVALLAWAPYYYSLQSQGGYAPIAANHAKYFVGIHGWLGAAARQIANQHAMETVQSAIAVAAALSMPMLLVRHTTAAAVLRGGVAIAAGLAAFFWTSAVVAGVGTLLALIRVLMKHRQAKVLNDDQRYQLGCTAVLIAWWGGLLLAVPCYTPYPRLALPWLLASSLGLSLNCAAFLPSPRLAESKSRWQKLGATVAVAALIGGALAPVLLRSNHNSFVLSFDRRGLLRIAEIIRAENTRNNPRVIYVYGEPAMLFQLRAGGEELVAPVQDVPAQSATSNGQPIQTLLLVGPHSLTDPHFKEQWVSAENNWQLLQSFDYQPSAIVWLDIHDPRRSEEAPSEHSIRVYRLRE